MADHVRTDAELASPPTGARRWYALAVLALGLAMVTLDGTVVGVSLPTIIGDLGLDFTQAQWVFCVYSVVLAVLLITVGRIGDRFGRRVIFVLGVLIFVGGSLLSASADSASPLIWGRIVQGIGGAAVVAGSLSTVAAMFHGRARVIAFTAWVVAPAAAAVVGAALGGWFIDSFTWPWIFLINVPIAVVVLLGTVLVPETRIGAAATGPDVDGWLLSTAGFALVVFALIEGQRYGWLRPRREFTVFGVTWSTQSASSPIPFVLGVGVLLLVLFVLWERHRVKVEHAALVDFSHLRDPRHWGDGAALLIAAAQFGLLFVLPLYLVNCLGLSTLRTSSILVVLTGCALISAVLTAGPLRAVPPLWLVRIGLAIALLAMAVTALALTSTIPAWAPTVLLACYGIGLGLASAPLTANMRRIGAGTTASDPGSITAATARPAGAALGVAVLGSTLSIGLGHFLPDRLSYVPGLTTRAAGAVGAATRDSAGGVIVGLRTQRAPAAVTDALANGFADATRAALLGVAVVLLLAFVVATRIPPEAQQIDAEPPGAVARDRATERPGESRRITDDEGAAPVERGEAT
ncbi:MFS transporter [Nocardia nova]|uniref:MFS transporter n=1 Tax=Nocardia nova TaxID=37330 RepID=A0A2S6ASP8_9NOCA|nr:MFS transporter [Nocardia nova]PPJ30173.1 MFS transporter [Nocardia nova]PPJ38240.1 MFS transporter [Nocardia nova]